MNKTNDQDILYSIKENEIHTMTTFKELNCPNLIKLHEILQTANNIYLITEYCSQGDLKNNLDKRGIIKETNAAKIIKHTLNGIAEILKKGYIHRDIKPNNILLKDGTPKIADFGFCITIEEM